MRDFRAIAGRLARGFGRRGEQGWRTRSDPVRARRRALREEVDYWRDWLSNQGGKWANDYSYRLDPNAEVADPALCEVLASLAQKQVSILDVGAGPVSGVGYRFPGKTLSLTPVDPLADQYGRLLAKRGIDPPARTERAEGERLLQRFGPDRFDIAYSRNALDHAVDPVLIIENMLGVVRPEGYVVLRHVRNEAVNQAYVQLHQWNFDERDGRFVIWRPGYESDLTETLAGRAETHCRLESNDKDEGAGWVVCVIRKLRGEATLGAP
ncbi:MAG: methyltransferase domain-containing protein [Actinomycetota bacterium]